MSNLLSIALNFLAIFIFLFFYFRAAKDEMETDIIFSSGFSIVFSSIVISILFFYLSIHVPPTIIFITKGMWFWGLIIGFSLGAVLSHVKYKLKFKQMFGSLVLPFLICMIFVTREFLPSLLGILILLPFPFFHKLKLKDRGVALLSFGIFFLSRALLALSASPMIAFTSIGKVEVVISAAISFLFFFSVYNVSTNVRRK